MLKPMRPALDQTLLKFLAHLGSESENYQTHNLSGRQKENRSGAAGEMGAIEGGAEEGCLESAKLITHIVLHSCSSENYRQLCCLSLMRHIEACVPVHSSVVLPLPPNKGWLV